MSLLTTASQTVGPYVGIGFAALCVEELAPEGVSGERITLTGRVTDGDGKPVNDAAVEIWQANAAGKYAHPEDAQDKAVEARFRGYGRSLTRADGGFRFATIKPGCVPAPGGGLQAPHIAVTVFMRGLLRHLATRVYFPGDPANAEDPVLRLVPEERRATLIARPAGGKGAFEWNIRLQGTDETVFFDL
ncbi:MAG TPA: protocatechuate 3,4-dioxygenase subunit alpha [Casimicrobiaceae bacterium]|nr:protocatechuate 3,4-dioxygenase subunit alpha [Casimicrobiaceae bacterium]